MPKTPAGSHFYAFMTVLLWSSAYVLTKVALNHFSAGALGLLRCLIASLALITVWLINKTPRPALRDLPWLFLSGASGFALYLLTFNRGSALLTPTTSCLIVSTAPMLTAIMARIIFREQLTAGGWLAVATAFGGVAILTLRDGEGLSLGGGIYWMSLSALLISLYNIIQRHLAGRCSSLQITAGSFLIATLLLSPFLPEAASELGRAPFSQAAVAVFLGIFPSALAYCLWSKALAEAPRAVTVANYMYLTPFLALLLEYLILKETPDRATLAGGAVILASLLMFTRKGIRK